MFAETLISDECHLSCDTCGCTDDAACNYDASASLDNGTCESVEDVGDQCDICYGDNYDSYPKRKEKIPVSPI